MKSRLFLSAVPVAVVELRVSSSEFRKDNEEEEEVDDTKRSRVSEILNSDRYVEDGGMEIN